MSEDITIGEHSYKTGKLDGMTQFHVARRLAPVMAAMAAAFGAVQASQATAEADIGEQPPKADVLSSLGPLADAFAAMKDEEAQYVITACLRVCRRAIGGDRGYSALVTANGQMMFDDMDMVAMLRLVWTVIEENLAGFFGGSLSISGLIGKLRQE